MFYYREKIPSKGTVVVADLDLGKETEHCLYATLPEYNGATAIIQKSELPKKIKRRNRILSKLRQARTIPCAVTIDPSGSGFGSDIIELSIRDVDSAHRDDILNRYRNLERLLKVVRFVSHEFKLDPYTISQGLYDKHVVPLMDCDINDETGVNDCGDMYHGFLMDHQSLVDLMGLDPETSVKVSDKLEDLIKEVESSSSLDFDLAVWKAVHKDAVFVIRDLFQAMKDQYPGIDLRYVGAPTYQLVLPAVKARQIDKTYQEIKQMIETWMAENEVTGFGLILESNKKQIKKGDVSISYPYKIEMIDSE